MLLHMKWDASTEPSTLRLDHDIQQPAYALSKQIPARHDEPCQLPLKLASTTTMANNTLAAPGLVL
jgi:hypothetical protein